ncbi:MAG: hypothetical protein OHM56_04905 [Spiroplasma phoeniceum]|nr:MAG: hypothetical protein OHM57_04310 [Spiroplasma phoeniceum]UZQ33274.1 MAG: hypothetical protein OHM56_04905 [Spiroplasma phoeniceum]
MWKLLTLITSILENPKIALIIIKLLEKYGNYKIKAILQSIKDIEHQLSQIQYYLNPNILSDLLAKIPKNLEIQLKDIGFLDKNKYKEIVKSLTPIESNWTILSSSWCKKGLFQITNKQKLIGNLTILIQSDNDKQRRWYGSYTYPKVHIQVWQAMKSATGKNGSGAGSVFWNMWLHVWLRSELREYVNWQIYTQQNKGGGDVKLRASRINKNLLELNKEINRYSNNFYNTKDAKLNNHKHYIDNKNWLNQHREYATNLKTGYKNLHTKIISKPKTINLYKELKKEINIIKHPINTIKNKKIG